MAQFSHWTVSCNRIFSSFVYCYLVNWLAVFSYWNIVFFQQCKIPFLLLKIALGIWDLKYIYSLRKKDLFIFIFVFIWFWFINVNKIDSHQRKTTCMFLCIQKQKKCEIFIYIQKARQFTKIKTICVTLFHKNPDSLRYAIFMKFLKLASIYIQKAWHFALRDVFIYKKPDTYKNKDNLHYVFLYTKSLTICATQFFMEFLKLAVT